MHNYYISLLTEVVGAYKIDQKQLYERSGLSTLIEENLLGQSEINLNAKELNRLFSSALSLTGDPLLGLKYGARINRLPQGILGYALMACTTSGDSLKVLVRYHRALLPSVNIELVKNNDSLGLRARTQDVEFALDKFYCEVVYAGILTAGAMLLGNGKAESTSSPVLRLDYPEPKNGCDFYRKIFGAQVYFGEPTRELWFDSDLLNSTLSSSNPVAQVIFERECERLLPRNNCSGVLSEKIKKLLISSKLNFPSRSHVAEQLHISESTLRRHLRKEGVGFQELLDDVRAKLAREYLASTLLPIAEVASLIGFSDSANFRRSFKRWTKLTPSEYRARC